VTPPPETSLPDGPGRRSSPPPLTVAASLTAVEALVFGGLAVAELAAFDQARAVMGATTALFFLVYAAGLGACAWALWRLRSWARAPVVVAQLIQVFVAASFWGGGTTWVAVVLAAVAVVVLVGLLHPRSLAALSAPED
jgi:hypothetical protein